MPVPKQKFKRGDIVYINQLPPCMSHFEQRTNAIVRASYHQQYGGGDTGSYTLVLLDKLGKPHNSVSWYDDAHLTLVQLSSLKSIDKLERYTKGQF